MSDLINCRAISVDRLPDDWQSNRRNLVLASVGYEQRARFVCETHILDAFLKVAAGFANQRVLEYAANIGWFDSNGFEVQEVSDEKFRIWIETLLSRVSTTASAEPASPIRILVDISCMSRKRMAHTIAALRDCPGSSQFLVDFVYALAAYTPPGEQVLPNTYVGPITSDFAGWWNEPDRTLSAIVGLGYEQDKALGAVEYLQAQDVWLFQPVSEEPRYTSALAKANGTLLGSTDSRHLFIYRLHDPLESYSKLRSLVLGLLTKHNVVFLPFGPKLFVLYSLLIAADDPDIAVWRVSATSEKPANAMAFGTCYGLRVSFSIRSRAPKVRVETR